MRADILCIIVRIAQDVGVGVMRVADDQRDAALSTASTFGDQQTAIEDSE